MFFDSAEKNIIGRIDGVILLIGALLFILYSLKHNNFTPDESEAVETVLSPWKASLWVL